MCSHVGAGHVVRIWNGENEGDDPSLFGTTAQPPYTCRDRASEMEGNNDTNSMYWQFNSTWPVSGPFFTSSISSLGSLFGARCFHTGIMLAAAACWARCPDTVLSILHGWIDLLLFFFFSSLLSPQQAGGSFPPLRLLRLSSWSRFPLSLSLSSSVGIFFSW